MLRSFQYICSAIYQRIYKRRPGGTPYFNLIILIGFTLFIHVMQVRLLARLFWDIDIMENAKIYVLIGYYLTITAIVVVGMQYIAPKAKLKKIEIEDKTAAKIELWVMVYFIVNFGSMMYLIVHPNI